jgi:hypothetical protein
MMKNNKIALILPLILSAVSCGPVAPSTPTNNEPLPRYDANEIISHLLDNVNVKVSGYEIATFEEPYSFLNYSTKIDVNRDYSKIYEEDGTVTPAIRDNSNYAFSTYLKAKDGGTYFEILNADNTVEKVEYKINYNKVLFNEYFANPFEYIDVDDFDLDGNLDLVKANLIVELLTGIPTSPKTAKFTFEDNYATSLDITFNPRLDIIESSTSVIFGEVNYDLNIDFSYNVAPLRHLTPRSNADEHITNALQNKTNYTMTFETDLINSVATLYVTENAIYYQNAINQIGPVDGDVYYKKVGNDTYESYVYKASVGKFNIDELSVKTHQILPDLTKINPNVVLHDNGKNYLIDEVTALNTLDDFIIPTYIVGDGYGIKGTIKLDENDNLAQYKGRFHPSSPFNITQTYFNYGSTSIPSWLDVDNIK